ncbi:hypothetical protein HanIR_Chr10g0484391 [Helianthus annuus]|nr:hypothetical protein HanIR_Chr10g0484391 [Helianthus annuus]
MGLSFFVWKLWKLPRRKIKLKDKRSKEFQKKNHIKPFGRILELYKLNLSSYSNFKQYLKLNILLLNFQLKYKCFLLSIFCLVLFILFTVYKCSFFI